LFTLSLDFLSFSPPYPCEDIIEFSPQWECIDGDMSRESIVAALISRWHLNSFESEFSVLISCREVRMPRDLVMVCDSMDIDSEIPRFSIYFFWRLRSVRVGRVAVHIYDRIEHKVVVTWHDYLSPFSSVSAKKNIICTKNI
jgi:hypothetical protein